MKFFSTTSPLATFSASAFLMVVSVLGSTAGEATTTRPQHQQTLSYMQRVEAVRRMVLQAEHEPTPRDVNPDLEADVKRVRGGLLRLSLPEVQSAVLQALQSVSADAEGVGEDATRRGLEENSGTLGDQLQAGAPNFTVSQLCVNHSAAAIAGLVSGSSWANQMLDAMGKPGPGVMRGNLNWPGDYGQCRDVRAANISEAGVPLQDFSGKYCTAYLSLGQVLSIIVPMPMNVALGVCVPDSCSSSDLTGLVYSALFNLNVTKIPQLVFVCNNPDLPLDTRAIVAIVVCSIFLLFLVTGTVLDILYVQRPAWKKAEEKERVASVANGHCIDQQDDERTHLLRNNNPEPVHRPQLGTCCKMFLAFSVYTNGSKLFSTQKVPGSLECVHGIRFLSMTWVLLGHVFMLPTSGFGINVGPYFQEVTKRWTFQALLNATVSVDSFFILSGLLVAYLSLMEMKKRRGKINWFLFYFHRFWRLTPVYMLVIMIYVCLSPYWGRGPFWSDASPDRDDCKTNWWTNLLYVNNLVEADHMCLGQSWYLSNDMQFYILSPLIFVPLYFFPRVGAVCSAIFLLVTSIVPAALTVRDEFSPYQGNGTDQKDYMVDFYIKPYNRMGPYVVGMLAGYFLYRTECRLRIGKVVNTVVWAVATASALAVLYGLYDHTLTLSEAALYNAVNRQVWGACVCWVVIACVTGNGGFVNTILSWSALVPLSRLTYCIYLIHILVVGLYLQNTYTAFYVNDLNLVMLFLGSLVACCMAAVVISLAFETPMMALEKVLFRPQSRSKPPTNKTEENGMFDGKPSNA